jgi:hypothetical protein
MRTFRPFAVLPLLTGLLAAAASAQTLPRLVVFEGFMRPT